MGFFEVLKDTTDSVMKKTTTILQSYTRTADLIRDYAKKTDLHHHTNKSSLDKISEIGGNFAYDGNKVVTNTAAYDSHIGNNDIHITPADKANWNTKYTKPAGGIPFSHVDNAFAGKINAKVDQSAVFDSSGRINSSLIIQHDIDHGNLQNAGQYTHPDLDAHLENELIHSTNSLGQWVFSEALFDSAAKTNMIVNSDHFIELAPSANTSPQEYETTGSITSVVFDTGTVDCGYTTLLYYGQYNSRVCDIRVYTRTGTANAYSPAAWEDWKQISVTNKIMSKPGRYVQIKVEFNNADRYSTPVMKKFCLYYGTDMQSELINARGSFGSIDDRFQNSENKNTVLNNTLSGHTGNSGIHVTEEEKHNWNSNYFHNVKNICTEYGYIKLSEPYIPIIGEYVPFDIAIEKQMAITDGRIILSGGKPYKIDVNIAYLTPGNYDIRYMVKDYTNGAAIQELNPHGYTSCVYTPEADCEIGVYVSNAAVQTAISPAASFFICQEIGRNTIIDPDMLLDHMAYGVCYSGLNTLSLPVHPSNASAPYIINSIFDKPTGNIEINEHNYILLKKGKTYKFRCGLTSTITTTFFYQWFVNEVPVGAVGVCVSANRNTAYGSSSEAIAIYTPEEDSYAYIGVIDSATATSLGDPTVPNTCFYMIEELLGNKYLCMSFGGFQDKSILNGNIGLPGEYKFTEPLTHFDDLIIHVNWYDITTDQYTSQDYIFNVSSLTADGFIQNRQIEFCLYNQSISFKFSEDGSKLIVSSIPAGCFIQNIVARKGNDAVILESTPLASSNVIGGIYADIINGDVDEAEYTTPVKIDKNGHLFAKIDENYANLTLEEVTSIIDFIFPGAAATGLEVE